MYIDKDYFSRERFHAIKKDIKDPNRLVLNNNFVSLLFDKHLFKLISLDENRSKVIVEKDKEKYENGILVHEGNNDNYLIITATIINYSAFVDFDVFQPLGGPNYYQKDWNEVLSFKRELRATYTEREIKIMKAESEKFFGGFKSNSIKFNELIDKNNKEEINSFYSNQIKRGKRREDKKDKLVKRSKSIS